MYFKDAGHNSCFIISLLLYATHPTKNTLFTILNRLKLLQSFCFVFLYFFFAVPILSQNVLLINSVRLLKNNSVKITNHSKDTSRSMTVHDLSAHEIISVRRTIFPIVWLCENASRFCRTWLSSDIPWYRIFTGSYGESRWRQVAMESVMTSGSYGECHDIR